MRNGSKLLGILGLLVAAALLGAVPQTAEDLFQKALRLETNEGKMAEAIALYQTVLKKFPENRQVAAEAQFRIGLCYERLGNQEAQNAYQTVIEDFGEQKGVVAKAKERLARLARPAERPEEPEGIRIIQVLTKPYTDYLGSVSPDGRFLAHIHWGEGDLAVRDLTTGEDRLLTHDADVVKGYAMGPQFSKDGKWIAYSWWIRPDTYDLLLVNVNDPQPRRLYHQEGEIMSPVDWLSDEVFIFTKRNRETKKGHICSLNISNGTVHELKAYDSGVLYGFSCSPDEKSIVYGVRSDTDGGKFDINLMSLQEGSEIPLIKHPADDRVLGWVPGRTELLFISDRSGTWDLWALPVADGKPAGTAKRVYTDIGEVHPVGFARNGDCFVGLIRRISNTLLVPFNPETGEIDERSGRSLLGSPWSVGWSPDGRFLTYGRNIEDLKTGEKQKFAETLGFSHPVCWSPDGNTVLVIGRHKDKIREEGYKGGVYAVDLKTGGVTEVVGLSDLQYNPPGDDAFPISDVQWSSDGKSLFYLLFTDRLVKRNLATGEEKILYKHPSFRRGILKRSPDGTRLLLATGSTEERKSRLFTIPVEGGKETDLCPPQGLNISSAIWPPDGKYIYFQEYRGWETIFWRVAAGGGVPEKIWRSESRAEIHDIRPDGKEIAMARSESTTEIRVIKNLVRELEKVFKPIK